MIGMRDTPSPYRMRTENLLPKFESARNPFATLAKAGQSVAQAAPVVVVAPVVAVAAATTPPPAETSGPLETSFLFDAQLEPVAIPVVVRETKPTVGNELEASPAVVLVVAEAPASKPVMRPTPPSASKPRPLLAWVKKVNPLAYLPARQSEDKPARVRTPVQTELSLERVKVMRNDLNDTDLEVIPARTAGTPEPGGPKLQPSARNEMTTLNRLTSRLFGAGQTQI